MKRYIYVSMAFLLIKKKLTSNVNNKKIIKKLKQDSYYVLVLAKVTIKSKKMKYPVHVIV